MNEHEPQTQVLAALTAICEHLVATGQKASLEYPACINLTLPTDRLLVFGFVDGTLGWDYHLPDGSDIDSGGSDLTPDNPVDQLIAHVMRVIEEVKLK